MRIDKKLGCPKSVIRIPQSNKPAYIRKYRNSGINPSAYDLFDLRGTYLKSNFQRRGNDDAFKGWSRRCGRAVSLALIVKMLSLRRSTAQASTGWRSSSVTKSLGGQFRV